MISFAFMGALIAAAAETKAKADAERQRLDSLNLAPNERLLLELRMREVNALERMASRQPVVKVSLF